MINTAHDADGSLSMSSCNWNITDYTPSEGDPEYNVRQSLGRALEEWRKDVVGCLSVSFPFSFIQIIVYPSNMS
jgi:hypothetical protein